MAREGSTLSTSNSPSSRLFSPFILALAVTAVNAAKPVAIDDTAYLSYARQIAHHPLDPYGFELFWYDVPDDAFTILAPPVVPYWLAAGIRLFGESPPLLKLWMFPFVWLLAGTVRSLLGRFAPGYDPRILAAIVLSPAVLPTVNLMLDVPALALGLAAVVLFARAADRGSWRLAIAAGVVAGLAMQTKYSALLVPVTVGWYALTRRPPRPLGFALVTIVAAATIFAGWELLIAAKYGQSHFLYHASQRQAGRGTIADFLMDKVGLVPPLAGDVGCLGMGIGLLAAASLGAPRGSIAAVAVLWIAGFAWIALAPVRWCMYPTPAGFEVNFANTFWITAGTVVLLVLLASIVVANLRLGPGLRLRSDPAARFLTGWLLIELAGYFALSPFGAARRVIGLVVIAGLFAAALSVRIEQTRPARRGVRWLLGFGVASGVAVAAIDVLDAIPEKVCAEQAAVLASRSPDQGDVWFAGHWGFQYYCTRAGMRHLAPGETVLHPGDRLVLPLFPDEENFYRPHIGSIAIRPPAEVVELLGEVVWEDLISAQTIPNFYCGTEPVIGRDYPRLRVGVFRVTAEWRVPEK